MISNIKNILIIFSLMVFLMGSVSAMELSPEVWVNAEWAGTGEGAPVEGPLGELIFGENATDTIDSAFNMVEEYGTVHVLPGEYPEVLMIDKPLDLVGNVNNPEEVIIRPSSEGSQITIQIVSSDVIVTGFKLDGTTAMLPASSEEFDIKDLDGQVGIGIQGTGDQAVTNVMIDNNIIFPYTLGIGIVDNAHNNIIRNNSIVSYYGILIDYMVEGMNTVDNINNMITLNEIDGAYTGIYLGETAKNNYIMENELTNNYVGMYLYAADENHFEGNEITNNYVYGIHLYGSQNNTFVNNHLEGYEIEEPENGDIETAESVNLGAILGIYLEVGGGSGAASGKESSYNTIEGNTITKYPGDIISQFGGGIGIDGSSYNHIENNEITNNGLGIGIIDESYGNTIENNLIDSNLFYGIIFKNDVENNVIENNIISNTNDDGLLDLIMMRMSVEIKGELPEPELKIRGHGISLEDVADYNIIFNNKIFGNADNGIILYDAFDNEILSNEIYNNENVGIYIIKSYGNEVKENEISNNAEGGITLDESSQNLFVENIIIGDTWIHDMHGGNIFFDNIENMGNTYYFADGTPSWRVYDIIDRDRDGWAEEGSDRPFSSKFAGETCLYDFSMFPSGESECMSPPDFDLEYEWGCEGEGCANITDGDWDTGLPVDEGYYYNLNISFGPDVITGSVIVKSDVDTYEFDLPYECMDIHLMELGEYSPSAPEPEVGFRYYIYLSFNDEESMKLQCLSVEKEVQLFEDTMIYEYIDIGIIPGTVFYEMGFNLSMVSFDETLPWIGYGSDWFPGIVFTPTGSGTSRSELDWDYEWDCETGKLTITTEPFIELWFNNNIDYHKDTTNPDGVATFILDTDGTYSIFSRTTSDYYSLGGQEFTVTFCKEDVVEEPKPEPEPEPEPEREPEEVVIEDEEEEEEEEIEEEVDTTELESLIERVEEEIWKGIDEFKDVDAAQNMLRRAKEAFNAGDYDLAEELAEQALTLAMDARAEMPVVDVEDVEAEVTEVEEVVEEVEEEGMNMLLVIVGLVVLGIIAYFGFKFLNKN